MKNTMTIYYDGGISYIKSESLNSSFTFLDNTEEDIYTWNDGEEI